MEKIFDSYKGVIIFYLVIALLSFVCASRINEINNSSQGNNTEIEVVDNYYA